MSGSRRLLVPRVSVEVRSSFKSTEPSFVMIAFSVRDKTDGWSEGKVCDRERGRMKVGLYFDLRNPPRWRRSWSRTYGFTLEMCEEAERLGADSVWFSEHHLFEDGYLPQPLIMAAAAAARTRR